MLIVGAMCVKFDDLRWQVVCIRFPTNQDHPCQLLGKRKGTRAALRKFRRRCAGCGQVPVSMTPNKCDIRGNF